MKKVILTFAFMLAALCAFAQNGKSLYTKYSDCDDVSAVYISPAMFRMIGKLPEMEINDADIDISSLIKSFTGFYLLDSENVDVNSRLKLETDTMVAKGGYELLMEAKDDGETTRIYTSGDRDYVSSLVLLSYDKNECTFISIDGRISRMELENSIASSSDN